MKLISNLVFVLAFVGVSSFWALALTGHLAPLPSAATSGAQAPAQPSVATVAPPSDKESGERNDNQVEAVSAPIEEVSAPPAPAKTVVGKSVKPRSKRPAQVRTRDRAAGEKS
jgi:hypothetical protein